jgi:hypothetical protein
LGVGVWVWWLGQALCERTNKPSRQGFGGWVKLSANERTNVGVGALFVRSHRSQGTGLHRPVCSFARRGEGRAEAVVVRAGVEGKRVGWLWPCGQVITYDLANCSWSGIMHKVLHWSIVSKRRVSGQRLLGSGSPRHVRCTTAYRGSLPSSRKRTLSQSVRWAIAVGEQA